MFAFLMGVRTISPTALHDSLEKGGVTVIDVNSPQSYAQARVPGAQHRDPARLAEPDLPPAKDATLVFYCSNPMCRKAPIAARRAKQWGYANALVMSAGISGWLAAGFPTESG
jgi:rhodanese-related sulfurtransferase